MSVEKSTMMRIQPIECCKPEVVEVFMCPVCKEDHDSEQAALDCHSSDSEAQTRTEPTYAELEAAGQLRIFA